MKRREHKNDRSPSPSRKYTARMKCQCGRLMSADVRFCADCGRPNDGELSFDCPCGVTVRSDQKFCHNCGKRVRFQPRKDPVPKVCTGKVDGSPCGYKLIAALNFCPNCGTVAPGNDATPSSEQASETVVSLGNQSKSVCTAELVTLPIPNTGTENLETSGQSTGVSPENYSENINQKAGYEQTVSQTQSHSTENGGAAGGCRPCIVCKGECDPELDVCTHCVNSLKEDGLAPHASDPPRQYFSQFANQHIVEKETDTIPGSTHASTVSLVLLKSDAPSHHLSNKSAPVEPTAESVKAMSESNSLEGTDSTEKSTDQGQVSSKAVKHLEGIEKSSLQTGASNSAPCGDRRYQTEKENNTGSSGSQVPASTGDDGDTVRGEDERALTGKASELTPAASSDLPLPVEVSEKDEKDQENKDKRPKSYAAAAAGGAQSSAKQDRKGNKAKSSGSSNNGTGQRNAGTLRPTGEKVNVVFHVIISKQFQHDPETDMVYIRRGPDWTHDDKLKMVFVRDTPLGPLYEGKVIMTREVRNGGFDYKYVVKKKEFHYEQLLKRGSRDGIQNRDFRVPAKEKSSSDFNSAWTGEWQVNHLQKGQGGHRTVEVAQQAGVAAPSPADDSSLWQLHPFN